MIQNKVRENIFLILAVVLTIFALLPLFHPGFFPVHDDEQIGRLFELNNALMTGQFPVRIIQDLGFGYGYLLFNFYPPFVYYLGEFFRLFHFSYIDSIKLVIGSGFIFSAIFMYLFVKENFGKISGLVAAVFYIYAPYHSVDVYVRGALPEFFSFVFVPAIFWSYLKLFQKSEKRYVIAASIFNFLLVITHNLVALMGSVFIGLYILLLIYQSKNRKRFIIDLLFTLVFSLLLSSFFIFPALLENKFTMVSLLTTQLADYANHFVYIRQFWNSPWGYGGSIYGLEDGLSFQVGKLQIILSILAIIISGIFVIKKKINSTIILFSFFLFFSLFMQTFYSKFIWDHIQALSYIQFPWRYLLFTAYSTAFLSGFIFSLIKGKKIASFLAAIAIIGVIYLNFSYFQPREYLNNNDNSYISQSVLRWTTSKMSFEYIPRGVALIQSSVGNSIPQIGENQISKNTYSYNPKLDSAQVIKDDPQEKIISTSSNKQTKFILNQFAYPGWKIFIDGKQIDFMSNNKLKLITFNLPAGKHIITAKFGDTPLREFSNVLSIIGILAILFYLYFYKNHEKN